MIFSAKNLRTLSILLLAFTLSFCGKDDDNNGNTGDPSSLTVEVTSIDHETGMIQLQASAQNATLYQLFIEPSEVPEDANNTGLFEYTFEGPGNYEVSIRAYGTSGRYIKSTIPVTIAPEVDPIPLSRGYFTPTEYAGYSMVWQDEFNGFSVNTDYWGYDIGNGDWGWGNNELQYYRTENAVVSDSVLTIHARSEIYSGFTYTSAKLKTSGKESFQYGRVDVRALLPAGQGLWPAIWMLGDNFNSVGWPDCGEIDIMEMIGGDNGERTVYGTVHWEFNGEHASAGGSKTLPASEEYDFANAYHVFSITWDENFIRWFMDDQQYHSIDISAGDMTEFHQPHWLILNVAVGGNWPGNPDASTIFPQHMKVDYIRVFQQE